MKVTPDRKQSVFSRSSSNDKGKTHITKLSEARKLRDEKRFTKGFPLFRQFPAFFTPVCFAGH